MRIVIALGGNALRRGDPMTTDVQRQNISPVPVQVVP
jgi:carbamate kinase